MISRLTRRISTTASPQALLGMITDPYSFFSAVGHVWIWGVFDRSSRSLKPFLKATDPDPGRRAGILALGMEEKGGKYHTAEVEIEGPTITGSGLMYKLKSNDERVLLSITTQIRQRAEANELFVAIEASYVVDWKSLFLSPIFGGKIDLDAFLSHMVDDHLRDYIKGYLEPKSSTSHRDSLEPVAFMIDDAKKVMAGLEEISKSINKGLVSVTGSDFVLVLEVEGGVMKNILYKDSSGELLGDEAIKRASAKSGRVRVRVYNTSIVDILLRLSR